MIQDPFAEYIRHVDAGKREKGYAWQTAIGLQDVDGLKPSRYLINTAIKNIEGEITIDAAEQWVSRYYEQHPVLEKDNRTEEADKVSVRIAKLLSEPAFSFNANQYLSIHKYLFNGISSHAGKIREFNITKKEWVLDGDTVSYGSALELNATLEYDLSQERNFSYRSLSIDQIIEHLALFISRLWQIHVFAEGNTRTTAVFFIKYLKTLGFQVTNDSFAENSWYFRNALVRANYNNISKGIYETTYYLVLFIRNLLLGEDHRLSNRMLHIYSHKYIVEEAEDQNPVLREEQAQYPALNPNIQNTKQDIESKKQDIGSKKQDIESGNQDFGGDLGFSLKTEKHIQTLKQVIGNSVFSRVEVINILSLTPSPASALIKKMLVIGIIEKVSGLGKGRYRFVK